MVFLLDMVNLQKKFYCTF